MTRGSVSARVLGFLIVCAVIKRRMGVPNPERLSRSKSAGAVLSQAASQGAGVVVVWDVLLFLGNGSFLFSNPPPRNAGILKTKSGVVVDLPAVWQPDVSDGFHAV
jgi:hypothetical protein